MNNPQDNLQGRQIRFIRNVFVRCMLSMTMMVVMVSLATAAEDIKLGVMAPYTGPVSYVGEQYRDTYELAIEDATEAGEYPINLGGSTVEFDPVWIDDEASPEKAVRAVQRAIQRDGIELLVGGFNSSVGLAVIDVTQTYGVLAFGMIPGTVKINEKIMENDYKLWFKGYPAVESMGRKYAEALGEMMERGLWTPATKKAAFLVEDTDWGRDWSDGVSNALEEMGWETVSIDFVGMSETAHAALMTKYKGADVSFVGGTASGAAAISSVANTHGDLEVGGLLAIDGLGWFPNWFEMTGRNADYAVSADGPRPLTTEQKEWSRRYEERFEYSPAPVTAGHVYDYIRMLIVGLNKAGTVDDIQHLSDTLLHMSYKGVWQLYEFAKEPNERAKSQYSIQTGGFMEGFFFPMAQHYNGEAYVVWPFEYAEGEFRDPPD